ncbi:hypothetical protein CDD80_6102 [Ophiocordyceps camponoti-rufipedis]|uniref:Uncharacterized protein n=1 Tax=Ophiocordyceps camponoti-rufipedis TaxID=2004952 RepID=A0A2C5YLC4_9HYPO|nr:hypothetical protein CDD80_6102 [Ophiocordyceps camponoti-rufipedis]
MDARPYRPRGSENMVPPQHQRNKSAGNVTALPPAANAGMRGPAKRSAFGDLTNTAKNVMPARDEAKPAIKGQQPVPSNNYLNNSQLYNSILPLGSNVVNAKSVFNYNTNGKKESFFRPPHRPAALTSKPRDGVEARQTAPSKPLPAPPLPVDTKAQPGKEGFLVARQEPVQESEPPAQASFEGLPIQPRHYKSQPQLKPQLPTLRRTQSKQLDSLDAARAGFNPPGVPSRGEFAAYPGQLYGALDREPVPEAQSEAEYGGKLGEIAEVPRQAPVSGSEGQNAALSEPEDCWDEVEDEDYDEQDPAYTTGHSLRCRDFTTGGVTTLLAPRVTAKVQRELEEARLEMQRTRPADDIEEELWDVSMVAEYGEEIFEYMRELEIKMLPNPYYMEMQTEIQWSMRSVLMDWLVQVHNRFGLLPETLFLTVNYIDRFLSCKVVSIGKLQLVGATAILVASKYEEINCPSLEEIVYMVDGGYSLEEILKAERFMLSMLSFELGWPGPMSFLRRVSKADDYEVETRTLAKYFLELTIMDERFVASPPSFLAAGAHCLSRLVLKKGDWTKLHVHYSGYTWPQLKPLVVMLIDCCDRPRLHHSAVYEKYKDRRFKEASTQVQRALDAGFTLPHHVMPVRRTQPRPPTVDDASGQRPYPNGAVLVSTEG